MRACAPPLDAYRPIVLRLPKLRLLASSREGGGPDLPPWKISALMQTYAG